MGFEPFNRGTEPTRCVIDSNTHVPIGLFLPLLQLSEMPVLAGLVGSLSNLPAIIRQIIMID